MMLKLSGDAGRIFSRVKNYLVSLHPFEEVKEEIEHIKPVNSVDEIVKRQKKVNKMIEIAKKVDFRRVEELEIIKIKPKFFEDRVYIAKNEEEYQNALKLGVCEVLREDREKGHPIILNDFVDEISLESFAPEIIIGAILENIETFRTLAELEMELFGNERYEKILNDLLGLEEDYGKIEKLNRIVEKAGIIEAEINAEIERRVSDVKLTITGNELLKLLEKGEITGEIERLISSIVKKFESEYINAGIHEPVFTRTYPVRVDRDSLLRAVENARIRTSLDFYLKSLRIAKKLNVDEINSRIAFYRKLGLYKDFADYGFTFPEFGDGTEFRGGKNIFINNPEPVSYCIGKSDFFGRYENIAILTGANSGGKTSLLELVCQIVILAHMGFPVNAERARVSVYDEIFYFKKKQSSYGSGAFEKAIMSLAKAISGGGRKLILIDEFESVTEPGAGAKILASLLKIANSKGHHVIAVSHLGEEFIEFEFLRIDGIEARGLDEGLNLVVTRQPVFGKIGKSTPELIIERLMEKSKGETREIFVEMLRMFKEM